MYQKWGDSAWRWRCRQLIYVASIKQQVYEDEIISDLWWDDAFNALYLRCRYIKEFCG